MAIEQVEITTPGKFLLWLAGIAAVIAALGRYVVHPVATAYVFYALEREPAKVRGLIQTVFKDDIADLVRSAREIRECQAEQGEQLARVEGYLTGRAE